MTRTKTLQSRQWVRRLWIIPLLLLGFGMTTNAQTLVQIGTGTNTTDVSPIYGCYGYTYNQTLFTESEITAGGWGGGAGQITKIRYYLATAPGNPANTNNWTVYLGNTTLTTMTAGSANYTPTSEMTQVFSGTVNMSTTGWMEIAFTTPFEYAGGNLIVAVDENATGYSCSPYFRYTTATGMVRYLYSDTYNPDPNALPGSYSGTSTSTSSRANIQMEIAVPCSGIPDGGTVLSASLCSGQSATLSAEGVTTGSGLSYQWQQATSFGGPYADVVGGTGGTTAHYTTASLSAGSYYYRLVTTCLNSGGSSISLPGTITAYDNPTAPTATNSTQCGVGVPTAFVTSTDGVNGSGNYNWYDAASGGNVLQAGSAIPVYINNFSTADLGNASVANSAAVTGGALVLHGATTSQNGGILVNASGTNGTAYQIDYDMIVTATGTQIADGISYSFGNDVSASSLLPTAEKGTGSKLRLNFMTYNGVNTSNGKGIYLAYGITGDIDFTAGAPGVLAYSTNVSWIPTSSGSLTKHVTITISTTNKVTVKVGGVTIFSNVQLPADFASQDKSTWSHVIKSRSGGIAGGFAIDNLNIKEASATNGFNTYQASVSSDQTFYVSEMNPAGCEGPRTPVTVTVATAPSISASASSTTPVCPGTDIDLSATSSNSDYSYVWEPGAVSGASVTVNPMSTTTYTVTATDNSGGANDGCSAIATVNVSVIPPPVINAISATNLAVCAGESVTLTSSSTSSTPYCTPTVTSSDGSDYINNFSFAGITHNGSGQSSGQYGDFTGTYSANVTAGTSYSISLQAGSSAQTFKVWIDYDQNGVFEASEVVFFTSSSSTSMQTGNITIPVTAINGTTRMRIGAKYSTVLGNGDACANSGYGEYEDYSVNITGGTDIYTYSWSDGVSTVGTTNPVTVSPIETTDYTVTKTDIATGCSATMSTTITVNPAPTITVTPASAISCGTPVALEASGADTYTWSPSDDLDVTTGANVTSTPTETRTYTVSGTDGAGCVGTTDVTVTYEEFTVTAVSSDADFCLGTSTTLSASNNMLPQLGPQTLPTGYCTPTVTSSDGSDMINNFSFASITNNNSGQSPSQYGNFTATYSADVIAGTSYPISLQAGSNSGQTFKVWIDYNRNGVFEASEVVFSTASSSTTVQTGNIVISPTATLGVTRMRVGSKYSTSLANGSACANTGYGEFEDYKLNIITVPAVTYTWSPATDLSAATGEEVIATPTAAGDYTYTVTATNDNGCTATNDVTITVNPNSVVTASNGSPVCEGSNVILTGTTTPSGGDYVWYYPDGSLLASGILSVNLIDADLNTNGTYSFSVTNELGCTSTATTTVVVNPLPSTITIAATDEEICTDEVTTLTASGGTISGIVAFYDGFEGATWTAASTGSISQNWHINADGSSNSWPEAIHSNDNSHYYIVDANASSSSGTMNATLTSPSFSTAGFESANLDFYHYLKYGSGTFVDSGVVQMSTDNVTWTTITNYQSDQGAPASFAHATLAVPAQFLNQTSVYIRFKFAGGWGYYWHIDNVSVTGSQTATVAWAPATGLYTDASATTAYAGEDITTVYAKPASSTTYTATATSLSGCSREASVEIAVTPPPVVTVTPDETDICEGSSAVLTASVSPIASTILEEDFNGATNDWTTIDNTIGVGLESPAWTLRPDGYSNASYYVTETFHSNDNSQFYMTNSDAPATSSVSVNTILQSPAFSTLGYAEASINYYQAYKLFADYMATTAKVEASTDGSTWTTLQDNTVSVGDDWELAGTSDGFVSASVPLTAAFLNQPVVYIRFNYSSGWEYYWAIDNVSITGTTPVDVTYTWSPAGGTVSGSNNENYTVNPSETTVYTATATTVGGCSSSTTATVNVNAVPAPVLATATDPLSCGGSNGSLTLESLTPGATYSVAYDKDGVAQSPQTLTADGSGQIVLDGLSSGSYTNVFVTNTTTTCSGPMPISAILNEPALPAPAVASSVDPSTCSGSDGSITLSGLSAGTDYSVAYDKDGVAQTPQSITADGSGNVVMTALSSGAYTNIIVTSSVTTCSSTSALSATLSSPVFTITATPADNTDCSAPNGSITITSSLIVSGQSYTWYYDAEVGSQTANASDAIVLEGLNAATYADIWVYDATTGCTSNTIASVTVGGTPVSDDITAVDASSSQAQSEGTVNYNNADCEKIATIEATNGDLGSVTAEVEVVGSVGTYNDEFYFGRVYHLTASNNVGGIVTLYFSDAEIAAYNTAVGSNTPNYPVVMSDGSNITITAFHGTPGSGSGPLNYDPATAELIIPSSIVHNANGYYEVTFSVGAFSGFFGTTNSSTPLPVKLVDVSAVNLGATNRVDWSTAAEADGDRFMIERSADAKAFNSLGTADAKGISGSRYSFVDANPFNGVNYYRIKVLNNDGSHFYSKVVQATVNMGKLDILAYPNPVKDELTVKANGIVNGTGNLILFDVSGRELSRTVIESNGIATFQMDHLAQGMYILKFQDDSTTQTIRVNKK